MVKNPPTNSGYTRDTVSITVLGRSPGVENGNPIQNSFLENSMGRGACCAKVHGAGKGQT